MDLQLHSMHVVVQGFILLMLASLTEPGTPTIVQKLSEEGKCDPLCDNTSGMFCLRSQCIECGFCPKDPFDVDRRGYLQIFTPCIQNGFCPRVCSPYLNFASHLRANETFCEDIKAPKVTTSRSTTEQVVETTTTSSAGVTSLKPEADTTTTLHPVIITNIGNNDFPFRAFYTIVICVVVVSTIVGFGYFFITPISKLISKRPSSSPSSLTEDTDPLIYEPLEIQLNEANKTATVKGLQKLNCNALQLCACLYNPDRPPQNWMLTHESDEMELPGVMIPHHVYTVKAGRVIDRRGFDCIAEEKVNTEEFTNVTLDEECSTTVENIFENIDLRRSLQAELHQREMIDVIVSVFKLKGDNYLNFKNDNNLDKLYNEVLTTLNDVVHSSIHILMEDLAQSNVAKDFVRKIAKRDTERYCKKCLEHLHSMCCRKDESVVDIP